MVTPKLVVLDLDGTVVGYGGDEMLLPSPRVRAAIELAQAAGALVTVATGRAVWNALPTVQHLGLAGIDLLCSNGAVAYDLDAAEVVFAVEFDPAEAATTLVRYAPDAGFACEWGIAGYRHTANFEREHPIGMVAEVAFDELVSVPTTRLVCRLAGDAVPPSFQPALYGERREMAEAVLAAADLDPGCYGVELGYSGWIDITAAGVSKGSGVALLAERLGMSAADTAVIGDGTNDLPMFAWAGCSVAMGQAHDDVKGAADEVTASVADDGVAEMLERWYG